jgi:hypothetical protein
MRFDKWEKEDSHPIQLISMDLARRQTRLC